MSQAKRWRKHEASTKAVTVSEVPLIALQHEGFPFICNFLFGCFLNISAVTEGAELGRADAWRLKPFLHKINALPLATKHRQIYLSQHFYLSSQAPPIQKLCNLPPSLHGSRASDFLSVQNNSALASSNCRLGASDGGDKIQRLSVRSTKLCKYISLIQIFFFKLSPISAAYHGIKFQPSKGPLLGSVAANMMKA